MDDDVSTVFERLVPNIEVLAGVKAVFGQIQSRVLCFAGRKDLEGKASYFAKPENLANNAKRRPFVVAIGGGRSVRPELRGKVLAVVQLARTYGLTAAFVEDDEERKRLEQWPVAVVARDVFEFVNPPHLETDLGFSDSRILENAYDNVLRDEANLQQLWRRLEGHELQLSNIPLIPHFVDDGTVRFVSRKYEAPYVPANEGDRAFWAGYRRERSKLGAQAKEMNRNANGGRYVCVACLWSDPDSGMMDAHHLVPLLIGPRASTLAHFAVLCPNCHRIAHTKGRARHDPLSVREIREWRRTNSGL